ncbi:hypothetical protein C7S14_8483 [Burkholderia cepacia]|nr:hypothetical protein [Burkholderia cepacia]QOH35993.1 hypothetical protein C7S14_8483 [Burkholderia cepacia]
MPGSVRADASDVVNQSTFNVSIASLRIHRCVAAGASLTLLRISHH